VPGYGDAVAQGGRYDETGAVFGRARPATGFSADLKVLAQLGARQFGSKQTVAAPVSDDPALWQAIIDLRAQGYRVLTELNGDAVDCDQRLQLIDGSWQLASA
ncbi:MAG: ATP phosphoribosyltransferase regulatory subunit, partial [Thalassolituus sp.]